MSSIPEGKLAAFRREHLGFIFQDFNLLDTFNVEDNIYLPLVLSGEPYEEMRVRLAPLANQLSITDILKKFPYEISGGQKQRVAAARALITRPDIVLADEPTGALDSKAAGALLRLLAEINLKGQTILMVSHSARAASKSGRVLFIRDGEVFHQMYRGGNTDEEFYKMINYTLTVSAGPPSGRDTEHEDERRAV
jgi:putative ABC transport system ATP-binding protein